MGNHEQCGFGGLPSATGGLTRLACAHAESAGVPLEPLLTKSGLTERQVANTNARVKVESQIRFLNAVSDAMNDDILGLHLALTFELRELGLLYYVMASSDRLPEAFRRTARYTCIVNEGFRPRCVGASGVGLAFSPVVERREDRHQIEFVAAMLVRACRQITGQRLMPSRVRFMHLRTRPCAEFRAIFGDDLRFGATADEVIFDRNVKDIPLVAADPYLNKMLVHYCEEALIHRSSARSSFRSRVENAIVPLLPHRKASVEEIALRLAMSNRSLARHLSAEGLTFSGVLDALRLDLARRYLADRTLTISQIAWLLGFQGVGAFSHAFRRWTGQSPRAARASVTTRPDATASLVF